jgi:UDP-glucuronate 4-epimerase
MKVLITGGAGFIGSSLAKSLLEKKISVVIVDNFNNYYNPAFKKENINSLMPYEKYLSVINADILKKEDLRKVFDNHKFDKIIHLAAYPSIAYSFKFPHLYSSNNIQGTNNILECTKEYGVKHFLFGSSSSIYGNLINVPFKENAIGNSSLSPYGTSKRAGESLCRFYNRNYNINMTVFRFFSIYGPRVRPDMASYKFTKAILKQKTIGIFGDGRIERDFTYIDDAVSAIMLGLEKQFPYEEFNVASSKPISLNSFIETLSKITGEKAKIKYLKPLYFDMKITYGDVSKAKNMLGYQPKTKLEEGTSMLAEWFKRNRI